MITRIGQMALLVAAWLALLAGVARYAGAATQVVVLFPTHQLVAPLLPGVAISGQSPVGLTLQSDQPGFVAGLYHSGAWLVLPAGLPCPPGSVNSTRLPLQICR